MNCWEILGIDPTRDRDAIDRAYEQQKKFAAGEELERLQQAYREARGEQPVAEPARQPVESQPEAASDVELTSEEQQVVREVVIQIKALLNDSRRASDEGIWRAILAEPPADRPHVRQAVAQSLEAQVRPMADNGSFPAPVAIFLGDWFGWQELKNAGHQSADAELTSHENEGQDQAGDENSGQPVTNFWPAVIGWVVALAVLAAVFEGIFAG